MAGIYLFKKLIFCVFSFQKMALGWKKIDQEKVLIQWAIDELLNTNWDTKFQGRARQILGSDLSYCWNVSDKRNFKRTLKKLGSLMSFFRYCMMPLVFQNKIKVKWYEKKCFSSKLTEINDWTGVKMTKSLLKPEHSYENDKRSLEEWGIEEKTGNIDVYSFFSGYPYSNNHFGIYRKTRVLSLHTKNNFICMTEEGNENNFSKFILIEGNHRARWYIRSGRKLDVVNFMVGVVPKGKLKEAIPHIL